MDLSLLPLVFSLILTVASRLPHPYSTDDKTSRLMVKKFSTVRDIQRGLQSYMQKREEGYRGDQEKRGNQKGRDQSSQSSNPYVLSTAWNTQRGSQSYIEKRRGRKEKWGSQKERDRSSASTFNKTVCTKVVFPKLW